MINEPDPILEPLETPQEVEIVPKDSSKVLKIGSAVPTLEKDSHRNMRIYLELIGR